MVATIFIGGRVVGQGYPACLVAEIGINHNGDFDLARKMIDAAAEAGADSVKFQNYRTEDFIADRTRTYRYDIAGMIVEETQYAMFKRCEMDVDFLAAAAGHCTERGVVFHSTPTSAAGVDELVALGVPVLKNGSDYLTNLDLIAHMARTSLPVVLSTGMATQDEVDDAVRTVRGQGNDKIVLLHCTSAYPTALADANLRRMCTLAEMFKCLVGFSDHTNGITAATTAVALGAVWIEKHFTTDRFLPGPDQRFSSDPEEFRVLVQSIRNVETVLGSARVAPSRSEEASRRDYRLSCVAARDIESGTVLRGCDVIYARPGTGLPPRLGSSLVGRRLARSVAAGHLFALEDFK